MILNRLEPGTECTVIKTGEKGVLKQIYFYPTKFELEFPDGRVSHFMTKQLEIDGVSQTEATFKTPSVPKDGKGESWSNWYPFQHESLVEHHFDTSIDIMWKMLTSLEMYNIWFFGIQRSLPVNETDRYVHNYSFEHFNVYPGKYFKIRPKSLAPYFTCRIMTVEKEKKFGFSFSTNPFNKEYVQFSLRQSKNGVWVKCSRVSNGFFSLLGHLNWQQKSKIFLRLDAIVPKINALVEDQTKSHIESKKSGGLENLDINQQVAYLVNKGLDGDMDSVNSNQSKVIRGKVKAMIVKINRGSVERPPMPEINNVSSAPPASGGIESLDNDQQVAYLVNKGLDGDMDSVNNFDNKVIRAKAKAMIVKINRGSVERPPMPEIIDTQEQEELATSKTETDEELINRLVAEGLDGDMEEINKLENKVIRGKIKAAIVKEKRKAN